MGCAQPARVASSQYAQAEMWSGRMSLQVENEPSQSFSASFELKGRPERGELTLTSPLGNVLGILRWAPGEATLDQGGKPPQNFASVDELTERATGAVLPVNALFAWLQGDNAAVPGWSADLTRQADGRIFAKRSQPTPPAELRVVLDR